MPPPKPRVVLDSSILIAAFLRHRGINAQVVARSQTEYILYTAEAIFEEVRRALSYDRIRKRYQYSSAEVEEFITGIRTVSEACFDELPTISIIIRDPKDNIILACALKAKAHFIVSKDNDLLDLAQHGNIRILSTQSFLAEINH